jgi:pyrimidine-nucleoside phosphorylase
LNAVEIIAKKRDGFQLSKLEIELLIDSYLKGHVRDYQMSAFLMAVFLKGMSDDETCRLTEVMLDSGDKITFPEPDNVYVDKHSTGGVGDKVSLILAPLAASCGVKVPMLSGRGLGHTGGTLDKLESIPGFRTDLTLEEFRKGVEKVGCVISGQTETMAPADRMLYALRDVTATVESVPLITGSILSKKLAAGPRGLVFDVKCGNGAFMKDVNSAKALASSLIRVARLMRRKAGAVITDMNQPLGSAVGNMLEVIECIEFLKGTWQGDLFEIVSELGAEMLLSAGITDDRETAAIMLESKLRDGSAFGKFQEMVNYQKGDLSPLLNNSKSLSARYCIPYMVKRDGYLRSFKTYEIGRSVIELGGGRIHKDDVIDRLVGFRFYKKSGDEVVNGEKIAEIHSNKRDIAEEISRKLDKYIEIGDGKPDPVKLIIERIH